MNLEDLTPEGGSLHASAAPVLRNTVAKFTLSRAVHPDEMWSPRGGELSGERPWRSDPGPDYYAGAESERPVPATHMGDDIGRIVRGALRPGAAP